MSEGEDVTSLPKPSGWAWEVHNENGLIQGDFTKEEALKFEKEMQGSCMPFIKRVSRRKKQ